MDNLAENTLLKEQKASRSDYLMKKTILIRCVSHFFFIINARIGLIFALFLVHPLSLWSYFQLYNVCSQMYFRFVMISSFFSILFLFLFLLLSYWSLSLFPLFSCLYTCFSHPTWILIHPFWVFLLSTGRGRIEWEGS